MMRFEIIPFELNLRDQETVAGLGVSFSVLFTKKANHTFMISLGHLFLYPFDSLMQQSVRSPVHAGYKFSHMISNILPILAFGV